MYLCRFPTAIGLHYDISTKLGTLAMVVSSFLSSEN